MSKRIAYFDILKGIAIFLVVMGHVLTMCVRDIDRAAIFKFIGEIHMPLFFFISGWFTFKILPNGALKLPNLRQRALQLLVPMVVVSSLWIWYFPHSGLQSPLVSTLAGLWSNTWKNGYWFTFVLFQIMVLYTICAPVFSRLRTVGLSIAGIIVTWAIVQGIIQFIPADVTAWGSFDLVAQFWPVFLAGAISARFSDKFNAFVAQPAVYTGALLIGAVLLYLICWPWEFSFLKDSELLVSIARSLFHICISIVAISLCLSVSHFSESRFAPSSIFEYLGRKSLSIYLLHYFFLFPLGACRAALIDMGLGFTPLFFFAAFVAVCIVALTLAADYAISRSPILALLLTGTVKLTKKKA